MDFYGWIVLVHIASAAAFVMTLIIMQLVVANVMKRIPESPGKKEGQLFIQKRWHPLVDFIIILVGASALYLSIYNFSMIIENNIFLIKTTIGLLALLSAYANHFYFRYKKRRLATSGKDSKRLKNISVVMEVLNKIALIGAPVAALLGLYINHV